MRGRTAPRPLDEIADAAVRVFTGMGFRTAGITDVAADLGLSHGALYTYVRSKKALLYLALLRTLDPRSVDDLTIPLDEPVPERIVALVDTWADTHAGLLVLTAAHSRRTQPIEVEFDAIIGELYEFIERNRQVLALVERCAEDLPELATAYFVRRRQAVFENLAGYLGRRIRSGQLRPVPDIAAATRFVVETIVWFASYRLGDPHSAMLDDRSCRDTVHHLLSAAFLPAGHVDAPERGVREHG
jgi:AcrR family transcriptional regulator